jgi:hypothetical protein
MAITIEYKGMKIKCSTPREAAELAKSLVKRNERAPSAAPTDEVSPEGAGASRAAAFLQAIREAGSTGITSQALAAKLGLESPKGLGMVFAMLDRYLQGQGSAARDLVARKRSTEGERIWRMRNRAQLDLALQSMEENGTK